MYPAEVLRRRASLVPDPARVAERARLMLELMRANDGIGLAAPQAGFSERFFVLHLPRDHERVFVNPEIVERSQRTVGSEESCLSLPGVSVDVPRASWVEVHAWDERGNRIELKARGLLGRAIQHEIDHLNGVLCIDHIDPKRRERIARRLEAYRSYGTTAGNPS